MAGPTITTGKWYNPDGLNVKFAQYQTVKYNFFNRPRLIKSFGRNKELEILFDLTLIPTTKTGYTTDSTNDGILDGFNLGDVYIPANSTIISCFGIVDIPAAGGTSFTLGTYTLNGTAVSANSLITSTAGALALWTPAGARVQGDGALTATTAATANPGVGTKDVFLGITTTGTYTAGTGRIYITYCEAQAEIVPGN